MIIIAIYIKRMYSHVLYNSYIRDLLSCLFIFFFKKKIKFGKFHVYETA